MGTIISAPSVQTYKLLSTATQSAPNTTWIPFAVSLSITKKYAFRLTGQMANAHAIKLYLNADTTDANYRSETCSMSASTVSAGRVSEPRLSDGNAANNYFTMDGTIDFSSDGTPRIFVTQNYDAAAAIKIGFAAMAKTAAVASITELRLSGDGVTNLFTSAKFSLYEISL